MDNTRLPLPLQHNDAPADNLAYRFACQQLAATHDIEERCRKSGAQYNVINSRKSITVRYLDRTYLITLPDVELSLLESTAAITVKDRILILHYLLTARGTPLANRPVAFQELPEGSVYYPTFVKRTIQPLVDNFGQDPPLLLEVSRKLGGEKAAYGDTAVIVNAFPRVPITIVLWRGDEEFPPRGNVLFDAAITHYLPTEDITVLCETIVWRLVGLKSKA